jgi:hypothetical protein
VQEKEGNEVMKERKTTGLEKRKKRWVGKTREKEMS